MQEGQLVDVRHIKYNVTREALERMKCNQISEENHAPIIWWDGYIPTEEFALMQAHQRINKIPNMDILCYKCTTFQALQTMKILYPNLFTFFPLTFQLPYQFGDFQREHIRLNAKSVEPITWIIKPKAGCSGNGIRLIQNSYDAADMSQPAVIQRYVPPYLIQNTKFDFRLYIYIQTVEPYTVYIYHDGLARFCSQPYEAPTRTNLAQRHSHLTNTAVNVDLRRESQVPILQLATEVIRQIRAKDCDRGGTLWPRIKQVVTLTMIAIYPQILKQIGMRVTPMKSKEGPAVDPLQKYFHILGIDIMLNSNMDPIVLELNDRPSLSVTFPLEQQLKPKLLFEAMKMVTADGSPLTPDTWTGGWEQIIPPPESEPNAGAFTSMIAKQRALNLPRLVLKQAIHRKQSTDRLHCRQSLPPLHNMQ